MKTIFNNALIGYKSSFKKIKSFLNPWTEGLINILPSTDTTKNPPYKVFGVDMRRFCKAKYLIEFGLIIIFYYYILFDTSIEVPKQILFGQEIGGGCVNNLGLMQDRQNGIIIGIVIAISGVICIAFNKLSIRTAKTTLCIECGKYFEAEPHFCPNCGKPTKYYK